MREIRNFKGKRVDNGKWIKGCYYKQIFRDSFNKAKPILWEKCFIRKIDGVFDNLFQALEVDPKTICQFTGLKDIKKRNIYEGDIILVKDDYYIGDNLMQGFIGTVMFQNGSYFINGSMASDELELDEEGVHNYQFEVMGNIHD